MAVYAIGPQGGRALATTAYNITKFTKSFTSVDLASKVEIPRVVGPHRVIVKYNASGFTYIWSFGLKGGTNRVTTNALPMFPNPAQVYDQTINYVVNGQDIPPMGCTVETQPISKISTSSRINIFDVTDSMSPDNLVLRFELCPFLHIPTTVGVIGGVVTPGSNMEISILFYRTTPKLKTNGIKMSYMAPDYTTKVWTVPIDSNGTHNPLDDPNTALQFIRFDGQQTIMLVNLTTGYYFSFDIDYGIIGQGGGYIGYVDPSANAALVEGSVLENCSISNVNVNYANTNSVSKLIKIVATTNPADGGGRDYIFEFVAMSYRDIKPTIQMTGTPFGNQNLELRIYTREFSSI
jgi:hypothetical protein